jgi:pyrophosphatase PpaX
VFAMAELFDVIIAADDVANHKPHPEPLLKALEKFDALPHEAIYVGDSIHDIAAGRAAQIATAAAAWGPFPRTELEELKPDYLLDEPRELLNFLKK